MRIVTENELAAAFRSIDTDEPRVVVSGNYASPLASMALLDAERARYRLFVLNAQSPWPCREGVVTETPFVGPGVRGARGLRYVPARLSLVPTLFHRGFEPDVVIVQTSPRRHDKVSLGIEVNILPAAIEATRRRGGLVIAQMNPQMPFTFGDGEIDIDEIDLAIEVDVPLASPVAAVIDDTARSIGEQVARFVDNGATLQLGIGAVPDAAISQLSDRQNLGAWSEMVSDGILELEWRGALDQHRPITCSFLFGSSELYRWANENERLLLRRTEVVNDPAQIESRGALISINTAIQVDLYAQANAAFVGGRIYSGFGGQPDFVAGALHSPGGHAIIALRSWHDKTDTSRVVSLLDAPVTSFQHSVILSEHGAAEIFGRTRAEQCELIIEHVADPRARPALRDAAGDLN